MTAYSLIATVLSLSVLFGFFNAKVLKLQTSIAMMLSAMILALILLILKSLHIAVLSETSLKLVSDIHFSSLLLNGLLSFLLFAGALSIDFEAMKKHKWEIGLLAIVSTLLSTALVAIAVHVLFAWVGMDLPWIYACLFGALISPTDPIAVLATFKNLGAPHFLEVSIAGESLFNDGVGIVLFTTLFELLTHTGQPTPGHVLGLFLQQAVGGIVYGFTIGIIALWLCRQTQDAKLMLLTTLAVVTGAYTFALWIGISGPIAMVVSGIWIGCGLRQNEHFNFLESIWETIDEILNAVLFLLLGFELLDFVIPNHSIWIALSVIPIIIGIRFITVSIPIRLLPKHKRKPGFIRLLTWGGLRGGLAVALALSLPHGYARNIILTLTYTIVSFSVIVQGLTMKPMVRYFYPKKPTS